MNEQERRRKATMDFSVRLALAEIQAGRPDRVAEARKWLAGLGLCGNCASASHTYCNR